MIFTPIGSLAIDEFKLGDATYVTDLLWNVENYFARKNSASAGGLGTNKITAYEAIDSSVYEGTQWRFEYLDSSTRNFKNLDTVAVRFNDNNGSSYIDRRYFRMNGVSADIVHSEGSTKDNSATSGITTNAPTSVYRNGFWMRPHKVTGSKTAAISYIVPVSGVYNVGYYYESDGNTAAQISSDAKTKLTSAQGQSINYKIAVMSANDKYDSDTTETIYKSELTSSTTTTYFPNHSSGKYKNGVYLEVGQVVRFIVDCSQLMSDFSNVCCKLFPQIKLVESDEDAFTTGRYTDFRSLVVASDKYYAENSCQTGVAYNMSEVNIDSKNTWSTEYLSTEGIFNKTDKISFSGESSKVSNRFYGTETQNKLFAISGENVTEQSASYTSSMLPTQAYKTLSYTYSAPVAGTYRITQLSTCATKFTPNEIASEKSDGESVKVGFSIVKMAENGNYNSAELTRVFPSDGDYSFVTDESTNNSFGVDADIEVYLKKNERLRFIVDVSQSDFSGDSKYYEVIAMPNVSLVEKEADKYEPYYSGSSTNLSGYAWSLEDFAINNNMANQQVKKYYTSTLTANGYPWSGEYLKYSDTEVDSFATLNRTSVLRSEDTDTSSATFGAERITSRRHGYEVQPLLISIQGGAYVSAGQMGGYHMSAGQYEPYLCTRLGHRVLSYTYTVPVSGKYSISQVEKIRSSKSVQEILDYENKNATTVKIGFAIHKMSEEDIGYEPSADTKLWPVDKNYEYIDNTCREFDFDAIDEIYLKKGEKLRFIIDAREATAVSDDYLCARVSPSVTLIELDETVLEKAPIGGSIDENSKPDLTGKTVWKSVSELVNTITESTNGRTEVYCDYKDYINKTPWRFQYQLLGVTTYYGEQMYYTAENSYLKPNGKGCTLVDSTGYPQNGIQTADYRINAANPLVNCITTGANADKLKPIAALTFAAPEDGEYWFSSDEELTDLIGIWPGQATEHKIKIWIEKDGVQIWPTNGKPMDLDKMVHCVEMPSLTVSMKKGSEIRICTQGNEKNKYHNNIYLAPIAARLGDYNVDNDPVPTNNEHKEKEPAYNVPNGTIRDSLKEIVTALEKTADGMLNTFFDFSEYAWNSNWVFQYRINGITDFNDDGIADYATAMGARITDYNKDGTGDSYKMTDGGRNEPTNVIQKSNFIVPGQQTLIHCINTPKVENSQCQVGALAFVATEDGTYWFAGNQDVTRKIGIWKGQATDVPIKVWIEKDGVQIWPTNGVPLELSETLSSVTIPEFTVAMKSGDAVRFCVQGDIANEYHNNVYLYPVSCRVGDYDLKLDPAPGMAQSIAVSLNGPMDSKTPLVDNFINTDEVINDTQNGDFIQETTDNKNNESKFEDKPTDVKKPATTKKKVKRIVTYTYLELFGLFILENLWIFIPAVVLLAGGITVLVIYLVKKRKKKSILAQ